MAAAPGYEGANVYGPAVLAAQEDKYDGIIVNPDALPEDAATFTAQLQYSLAAWRAQGKRGIWLQVPVSHVHLVPMAVQQAGFEPHHAASTHIMLIKWLPSTPCTLPPAATHQVGVGAFVINRDKMEVLVVQERNGPLRGRNVWKMPTGLVNDGEDIHEAAAREVLEETGIRAQFDAVLAIRQAHGFSVGGKSDLFVVVGLVPKPGQGEPTPQEAEIVATQWMPLQAFNEQKFMEGVPLFETIRGRCTAWAHGTYNGWKGAKLDVNLLGAKKRSDLTLWGDDHVTPGQEGAAVPAAAAVEVAATG